MTNQRNLKTQIRSRMKRTGERYTTARAHVLAGRSPSAGNKIPFVGGQQSEIAAATNLLNASGVTGPDGSPLSEAQVFGLSGGVGFLYGVFRYDTGPTMTITTRNTSMPDTFLDQLWTTDGLDATVSTTGGAKKAAAELDAILDAGRRTLVTVGAGAMGYLGLPPEQSAMYPIAVGVVARDCDDYLIDDRSPIPHRVDAEALKAARAVVRSAKHRMIEVRGGDLKWDKVIPAAIATGAERYNTAPVKQFAPNVGLAGLAKWQHQLTDRKDRMSWAKVFTDGANAALGFSRLYECIEHAYTAPAAGRVLYAEFLRWAADVTSEKRFRHAADRFEWAGRHWSKVAELAASAHPAVSDAARFVDKRAELLDAGADPKRLAEEHRSQNEAIESADITSDDATSVRELIAAEVAEILEREGNALAILGTEKTAGKPVGGLGGRPNRVTLLNPNTGRSDNTIARTLYNPVKMAILTAVGETDGLRFSELSGEIENRTDPGLWKEPKVGWYTTSVKLDLEARGLVERFGSPQKLRLTDAGTSELDRLSN
jgi:hypothetical protein